MSDDKTGARRGEPMVRRRGEMLEACFQELEDELLYGKVALFRFAKKIDVVRPEAFVELKVLP